MMVHWLLGFLCASLVDAATFAGKGKRRQGLLVLVVGILMGRFIALFLQEKPFYPDLAHLVAYGIIFLLAFFMLSLIVFLLFRFMLLGTYRLAGIIQSTHFCSPDGCEKCLVREVCKDMPPEVLEPLEVM